MGGLATVTATQPPTPQELEELRNLPADQLRSKLQRGSMHDSSLPLMNLLRSRVGLPALQAAGPSAIVPHFGSNPLPRTGDVNVLLVLCEFQDHRLQCSNEQYREQYFRQGDSSRFPNDSLRNYYLRSSGDQLRLTGEVFRVRLPHNRAHYQPRTDPNDQDQADQDAFDKLIKGVLSEYHEQRGDPTRFDYNGDGKMDFIHIVYAGPREGWASFFWAWSGGSWNLSWNSQRGPIEYSGRWVVENEKILDGRPDPSTAIHEYGHALGLPDLYDYDDADPDPNRVRSGPDGGVGGLDMMASSQYELNGVFRWALGWSDPLFMVDGRQTVKLAPRSSLPVANEQAGVVLVPEYVSQSENPQADGFPGPMVNGLASSNNVQPYEFYLVEYRVKQGNDQNLPGQGVLIWHVQLTDPASGDTNNNQSSVRKLIRLVEADDGNDIIGRADATASDFFTYGQEFGTSSPNAVRALGYPVASGLMPGPDVYAKVVGMDPNFAEVQVGNSNGRILTTLLSQPNGIEEEVWRNESREVVLNLQSGRNSNDTLTIQTNHDFGMSVVGGDRFQLKAGQTLQKTLVFGKPEPNWFGRREGFLFLGGQAPLKRYPVSLLRLDNGNLSWAAPLSVDVTFPGEEVTNFSLNRTGVQGFEKRPLPYEIETPPFIDVLQAPDELSEGANAFQFVVSSSAIPREEFPDDLDFQNSEFTIETEITVTDRSQQKVTHPFSVDVRGSRPKAPVNPTAEWWVPPASMLPSVRQSLVSFRLEWEQPNITTVEKTEMAVFTVDASAKLQAGSLSLSSAREGRDFTTGVIAGGGQLSGLLIASPYPDYRDQLWAVRAVNPWGHSNWTEPTSFPDEAPPQVGSAPKLDLRDKPIVLDPNVLERLQTDLRIPPQELEKLQEALRPIPNPNGEFNEIRNPDLKRQLPLQNPTEPLKPQRRGTIRNR